MAAAALAVGTLVPAGAAQAATVVPRPTNALPQTLDVATTYREQYSCDPVAKPGVEKFLRMLLQTYTMGHSGGIVRGCGIGATSEHKEGRAVDFMLSVNVPQQKAAGDAFTAWLTGKDANGVVGGNARRLGVMYVIWNKRIWGVYNTSGWRPYSGADPHTSHFHVSFSWDGAMGRTSWWDSTAVTNVDQGPCRVYSGQPAPVYVSRRTSACPPTVPAPTSKYGIVWPGQSGSSVKVAQSKLGLTADGAFGPQTRTALFAWQRRVSVPLTGVLDKPTWAKLVPSGTTTPTPPADPGTNAATTTLLTPYLSSTLVRGSRGAAVLALQKVLGITPDGEFGSGTENTVIGFQASADLPPTGQVDPATWATLQRLSFPLLPYRAITLKRGVTGQGAAVQALQTALGITSDGIFGSGTEAAVKAAQGKAGLTQSGVVDTATWVAVEAAAYPLGTVIRVAASTPVDRLAGQDRFGTAAAVARTFTAGVPVAYVASGMDFPDALAAAAAAGSQGSPVLLTTRTSVPAVTQQSLGYLKPKKIVVLGGTGSVADSVVKSLHAYTAGTVTRVGGTDRFDTAAKVSASWARQGVPVAYVASGSSFADALSGAAVAGAQKAPVLLTTTTALPKTTVAELKRLKPGRIVVLGGSGVVSSALVTQLDALTTGSVTRLAGDDRYETAAAVAASVPGARSVYVASGQSFPDALAGAALAAKQGVPVLLVTSGSVPLATRNALRGMKPTSIVALGGVGPVSDTVASVLGTFEQH